MKGLRFYEEFHDVWKKRRSAGCVVAIFLRDDGRPEGRTEAGDLMIDAIVPGVTEPDAWVASSAVSRSWLRKHCKRVTEERARKIHPRMFRRLDGT